MTLQAIQGRPTSRRSVDRDRRPLDANVLARKGYVAVCRANGFFAEASGAVGEVVVGIFYETVDNTLPGNTAGGRFCDVDALSRERWVFLLANDTVNPVPSNGTARERPISVLNGMTATAYAPGAHADGGTCYDVTTEGVWVEFPFPASQQDEGQPAIQSGTSTLVAGTKTISGVTLTPTSVILVSMRDPGAGAIPAFASLDAPVASRNVGAGSFVVNAIDNTKATIATAVSTFDYLIVG